MEDGIEKKITENGECSICGGEYRMHGNNSWPLNDGRCCKMCNEYFVIPARIARYRVMLDRGEL
jgi:hypothetical protein